MEFDPQDAHPVFDAEGAFDVLSCDDLSAALAACAPPPPSATDPLPQSVLKTFRAGVDGCLLLEHTVPHRVLPQLLRPVVGPHIEGPAVELRNAADASLCVQTITTSDDMSHSLASYARHLRHVTSIEDDTCDCDYDMRTYIAPEMQATLKKLVVAGSWHVTTKALRRLLGFKQLTHLDVSFCTSLRTTAFPHIAQLANLEVLDIQNLQKGRQEEGTITIPEEFATLTRLRVLTLGWHHLASLAPLRHLQSLEELVMSSATYPSKHLRHLAGLSRLQSLSIENDAPCLLCIKRLSHLTTLSLRGRLRVSTHEIAEIKCLALTTLVLPRTDPSWASAGVPLVASIPTLTSLDMYGVSDAALADVARSHPRLKRLSLSSCVEMATLPLFASLEHLTLKSAHGSLTIPDLASLQHLQHLELSRLDVLNASTVQPLTTCKSLTHLELYATVCDESGFDALRHFATVEVLEVSFGRDQPFRDEVAQHLGSMPRLRRVRLRASTEVTQLFQRELPWVLVQ